MDARVVVIGAGPAGALLAYLLASRGFDTVLIERQDDFAREFRGEFLMPSGLAALEDAGVGLEGVSLSQVEYFEGHINGKRRVAVELGGSDAPRLAAVSQPELLEHLVALGERTGHLEFLRGTVVRRLERTASGSTLLHTRCGESERQLEAEFWVGADGRGSATRRFLAPRVVQRSAPLDIVWFKMAYPEDWRPQVRFVGGRGQLLIAGHSADDLLQIGWVILKGTYGELRSRSADEWIDALADHADPELATHLEARRETTTRPFLLNAVADRVFGWATPGSLLLGDAAHTMSPVGGQGVNIALRDAIVAANELVPALRKGQGVDAAAARIEALRAPEVDGIQRLQAIPPRVMMGRTVVHGWIRSLLGQLMGREGFQRVAAHRADVFLDGVTDVKLRV